MSKRWQSFRGVACVVGLAACGSVPADPIDIDAAPEPDTTGPRVVQTMPANGATAVDVEAPIRIMFDETIDPASVAAATVTVTGPGGAAIAATITTDDTNIIVDPTQRLPGNAFMMVNVTTTVRDLLGNALTDEFSWTFTSGYGTTILPAGQEFTVRDIPVDGTPDVFVGGTPPPKLLFIKKGTEDRAVVEFDISQFPADVMNAKVEFESRTLDPGGGSTRLSVFRFDGNGVPDLSDFSRTQTPFAEEFGANESGVNKAHSFPITAELENARSRGVRFLGLLILAQDATDRFDLVPSTTNANQAPRLTVVY
jgi:Bacterial Ig-like domain